MIYIVVPTYNRPETCAHFIQDLEEQSFQDYLLVLVDHGARKFVPPGDNGKIAYIQSDVNGWARAVNVGLRYVLDRASDEDYVLIINDDVILSKDYLQTVKDSILLKPNAVLGTCCIDQNTNKVLRAAIRLNRLKAKHIYLFQKKDVSEIHDEFLESDVLTGKGTLFPVRMLCDIGIYNEEKLPHYKADHELVWRAKKAGYEVLASTRMQLRTLSDQKRASRRDPFWPTVKFMYFDMRSTMRLKDWWNYAFLAYPAPYALYFFIMNFFYNTVGMLVLFVKK